ADHIVLSGVFKQESIPENERLHPETIVAALKQSGKSAALFANADAIVRSIVPQLRSGDVVAVLSNGGFDGIYEKLPRALEQRTFVRS
ncbi:MAG TPA: UDP-N-acetylmuramate:L-alanyl-gamma-D-glutamyl-meso-diaminopimelate ligase, partial [Pseudacidobacterium sp.]|nr:UDP-N-acetylmuramate:L-alanyl-gamma-D-glutamyl-meso-diaminopimelate ligase [Pseudacidobacterium sp.]